MNTRRKVYLGAAAASLAAAGAIAAVALTDTSAVSGTVTQQTFTHEDVVTYTIPDPVTVTVTVAQPPPPPPGPPPPPPPPPAQADFWVAPTGSDTGPGTYAQPFKTIQHAANLVTAGQRVGVKDGTYADTGAGCSTSTVVCVTHGGTSASPVVFFAEHKWGASIDGHGLDDGFDFASGANYVTLDGFDVHNLRTDGGSVSGFELFNGGTGSKILNCQLHDIGQSNTTTTNGQVGVFTTQPNVTVQGCYMHDIGRTNADATHDHGVYLNAGNNDTITGNYFDTFAHGWAIQLYPGAETGTSITNNVFVGGNPSKANTHIILGANLTTVAFTGNTFWSATASSTISDYQGRFTGVTFNANTSTGGRWCDASVCTTAGGLPAGFTGSGNTLNAQMTKPPPPQ